LVEFWEDHYHNNPIEAHRQSDGQIKFEDTGDPLIDKWEEQISVGENPNFMEAFTPEQFQSLQRLRSNNKSSPRTGRTMKDTMDSVSQEAKRQGLQVLPSRSGWAPGPDGLGAPMPTRRRLSTFGDGSE
jgi:hypothetical protein